jgi:DNA primase
MANIQKGQRMAGFFAEEFLTDVLARNDIVDVIGEYVQLKRKGQSYWGLCPFHGEKTPSFSVAQDKQFYYCFGCHAGGNAFQFIQNIDKCDFGEAVEVLAWRAGLQMPEGQNEVNSREKEELRTVLYEIGRAAARFYHDKLYSREGLKALEYLQNRGLSERIIKRFGLGFAPDNHDEAVRFLEAQGFSREHLKIFAVAGEKEGRWYDYFRNRVMYPIIDKRGRVIGFGGRVMDDSQPKYLNSPETPIFNKRLNLFGLNLVQQIRNLERIIIVEGYMDVISMHQAGLPYTVASLGTALTEEQARLMKRYADEVYLAYDGDSAGQKATLRGLDILKDAGLRVRVIEFPDNLDPDDYAKRFGLTGLEELMDKASPLIDYKLRTIAGGCDLRTEEGRHQYVAKSCREVLAKISSPVELDIYVKRLSRESGVSEMAIYEESGIERSVLKAAEYSAKNSRNTNAVIDGPSRMLEIKNANNRKDNDIVEVERYLLQFALTKHGYNEKLWVSAAVADFTEQRNEIATLIFTGKAGKSSPAEIMNFLSTGAQEELARILTLVEIANDVSEKEFDKYIKCLTIKKLEEKKVVLLNEFKEKKDSEGEGALIRQEYVNIDSQLKAEREALDRLYMKKSKH